METALVNVGEDGIVISPEALPKVSFKTYEPGVVEFGNKQFPLNLYESKGA